MALRRTPAPTPNAPASPSEVIASAQQTQSHVAPLHTTEPQSLAPQPQTKVAANIASIVTPPDSAGIAAGTTPVPAAPHDAPVHLTLTASNGIAASGF